MVTCFSFETIWCVSVEGMVRAVKVKVKGEKDVGGVETYYLP